MVGRPEKGALPDYDSQEYKAAVIPAAYLYTQIYVTGQVMRATRSNAGSFIRAVRSEIEGAGRDSRKAANRQAYNNGPDALAYYVSGSGTAIVVDDNLGNAFTYLPAKAVKVDLIDATDHYTALNSDITITVGDEVATGFNATLSGAISGSVADGDYFIPYDTQRNATGPLGYSMQGLGAIISDADPILQSGGLHGLTVSGRPWWKSQIVGSDASKQDLRFALMQRVISKIVTGSDFTKDDIKFILANPFMVDKYVDLCVQERRAVNVMQLDGGYEGVAFNGIPIVADADAWHNRMLFVVPEALKICRMADFAWMDEDGAMLRKVSGYDAYEATLFAYMNFATVARAGLGGLLGINE